MSGERVSDDRAPIRVLAVDDHQLIRVGIATLLLPESDMKLVGEATNGREAIVKFRECRPDVTLMDLQMPEMSGFDAIIAIRDEFPGARIIVLTTYAGDAQAVRAMKAGAQGYLLKSLLHKELLQTIRAVHAGRKAMTPDVAAQLAELVFVDLLEQWALVPARIGIKPQVPVQLGMVEASEPYRGGSLIWRGNPLRITALHASVPDAP